MDGTALLYRVCSATAARAAAACGPSLRSTRSRRPGPLPVRPSKLFRVRDRIRRIMTLGRVRSYAGFVTDLRLSWEALVSIRSKNCCLPKSSIIMSMQTADLWHVIASQLARSYNLNDSASPFLRTGCHHDSGTVTLSPISTGGAAKD